MEILKHIDETSKFSSTSSNSKKANGGTLGNPARFGIVQAGSGGTTKARSTSIGSANPGAGCGSSLGQHEQLAVAPGSTQHTTN
jgi:hypothetical protein